MSLKRTYYIATNVVGLGLNSSGFSKIRRCWMKIKMSFKILFLYLIFKIVNKIWTKIKEHRRAFMSNNRKP